MPRVKIKQLDDKVATAGLHFGGPRERRKLHPGEVVEIPEGELLDQLWATGKLEMTLDPVTRPLDYATPREAQITAPTYKSRGPHEDAEIAAAHEAVALRLSEAQSNDTTESPAADEPEAKPTKKVSKKSPNRRASRRARRAHGQEATA